MEDEIEGEIAPDESELQSVEADAEAEVEGSEPEAPVEGKKNSFGERISELTSARDEAKRQADYWREMAMRAEVPKPEPEQPKAATPAKSLKDFDYDESQYTAYLIEQAQEKAVAAARTEASKAREELAAQQRAQSFNSRVAEFTKEHSDYHSVVTPSTPISQPMAEVIQESEIGPELAYYLGKNPDTAYRLYSLSPVSAARELGKIEARLASEKTKPKEVSKAPPPAPKVQGTDPGLRVSSTSQESDKLSDAEWFKAERARIAKRK